MLNFARSSHTNIADYYDQFMSIKFKDNRANKVKYSIMLILSFLCYQKSHYFLDLYYWLLNEYEDKQIYELFVETKALTLSLQNVDDIAYINLDLMYLEYNEMVYVINKALGYDSEKVQQFFEHQKNFIKEEGQQCVALVRNDEVNISVFLGQVVREFLLKSGDKKETKQEEIEKAKERISNLQGLPRRETGLRELVTSQMDQDQLRQIQNEAKQEEIDKLKEQIRKQKQLQNDYKRSTISLMSTLTILDPLTNEIMTKFQEFQEKLDNFKKNFNESQLAHFERRTQSFDKVGLSMKKGNVRNLNKTLLHLNPSLYKKIQQRIQEAIPKKKIIRDQLKEKILSEENKELFDNSEALHQQSLKYNIEKLVQKKPNLGDFFLLSNFYNNKEDNEDGSINLNYNLRNVGDKLLLMIDQLTAGKELIRTESTLMRNWDTAQQKIDKLNQMNQDDFMQYQTENDSFKKQDRPSKLNELLQNKNQKEEQIVNMKKKTLASTFEFVQQADQNENLQSTQNDPPQDDKKSITDMNEECLEEQNSMRENSDIEEDNMNVTELEKSEIVKTKNLVEQEPPMNRSESIQKTEVVQDMDDDIDHGIEKSEFATLGFKQTFGGRVDDENGDSQIDIEVKDEEQIEDTQVNEKSQSEQKDDESDVVDDKHEQIEDDEQSDKEDELIEDEKEIENTQHEQIQDEEEDSIEDEQKEQQIDDEEEMLEDEQKEEQIDEQEELVEDEQREEQIDDDEEELVEDNKSQSIKHQDEQIEDEESKKSSKKSSKSNSKKSSKKSSRSSSKKSSKKSLKEQSKKSSKKSFSRHSDLNEENENFSDYEENDKSNLNQEEALTEEEEEILLENSKVDENIKETELSEKNEDQLNQSEQRIRQVESFYEKRKTLLLEEGQKEEDQNEQQNEDQNEQQNEEQNEEQQEEEKQENPDEEQQEEKHQQIFDREEEQQKLEDDISVNIRKKEKEDPDAFHGRYSYDLRGLVKDTEILEEYFSNRSMQRDSKSFRKKKQII